MNAQAASTRCANQMYPHESDGAPYLTCLMCLAVPKKHTGEAEAADEYERAHSVNLGHQIFAYYPLQRSLCLLGLRCVARGGEPSNDHPRRLQQ